MAASGSYFSVKCLSIAQSKVYLNFNLGVFQIQLSSITYLQAAWQPGSCNSLICWLFKDYVVQPWEPQSKASFQMPCFKTFSWKDLHYEIYSDCCKSVLGLSYSETTKNVFWLSASCTSGSKPQDHLICSFSGRQVKNWQMRPQDSDKWIKSEKSYRCRRSHLCLLSLPHCTKQRGSFLPIAIPGPFRRAQGPRGTGNSGN